MKNIQALAETLAELARVAGYVVTIEQVPLEPLAMGNHVDRVTVRPARKRAAAIARCGPHILFCDSDPGRPDEICDANGQVALSLCKICGRAEAELVDPCTAP